MNNDPFAGMTDTQVLALARARLQAEVSLPPHSAARIAQAQQFDHCKAEFDRRMLHHVLQRLNETTTPVSARPSATASDCPSALTSGNRTYSYSLGRNRRAWHAEGRPNNVRFWTPDRRSLKVGKQPILQACDLHHDCSHGCRFRARGDQLTCFPSAADPDRGSLVARVPFVRHCGMGTA
jgi:hypothetical protein